MTPPSPEPTPIALAVYAVDFFPGKADGIVVWATWLSDTILAVGYNALVPYSPEAEETAAASLPELYTVPDLEWLRYDLTTGVAYGSPSPLPYDVAYWSRNDIVTIADYPELYGYFSPSGEKVIYNVWHGGVFDPASSTQIMVADTSDGTRTQVFEFGFSNVYIYRAQWDSQEEHVYFTAAYEGPAELYAVDLQSNAARPIAETTEWDGVTEDTFRLSPDDKSIAVIDTAGQLLLVSLEDGLVQSASSAYSSLPIWSPEGDTVYYWWGPEWLQYTEFRALDFPTLASTTLFDAATLADALRSIGRQVSPDIEEFLLGGIYAISPSGTRLLLWQVPGGPVVIDLGGVPGA